MTDPQRTDRAHAGPLSDADREARIEHLLLSGLDEYFAGKYERAINIWTRVAFLERGHGRARAYIERARSALAEQQRESEELLDSGVAAYHAGDLTTARDLLTRSVEQGGPSDTALVFLQRLTHVEVAAAAPAPAVEPRADRTARVLTPPRSRWLATALACAAIAAGMLTATRPLASWLSELPVAAPAVQAVTPEPLPIARPSDVALDRARALIAEGRLHEAQRLLERVDIADVNRPDADRLRGEIQQRVLDTVRGSAPSSESGEGPPRAP